MASSMSTNQVVGILLIVLGALLLLGWLHIPYLATIIGVVLIVLGVLALMGAGPMSKNTVLGVVLIVLGILILVPFGIGGAVASLLLTVVAIILIVVGVLKLMGKM